MPLFDRERNIDYVLHHMRTTAEEINDPPLTDDIMCLRDDYATSLEYYASVLKVLQSHGTRGYYNAGCHCEWCTAANRQYYQRRGNRGGLRLIRWEITRDLEEGMEEL